MRSTNLCKLFMFINSMIFKVIQTQIITQFIAFHHLNITYTRLKLFICTDLFIVWTPEIFFSFFTSRRNLVHSSSSFLFLIHRISSSVGMTEIFFPLLALVIQCTSFEAWQGCQKLALLWFGDRFGGHVHWGSNIINLSFISDACCLLHFDEYISWRHLCFQA